jgi:predicted phage tail protein
MVRGAAVTVSATADDGAGSGIASVDFEYQLVGAGSWTAISSDTTAPYSASWNTTTLPADGLYNLRVTSHDRAAHASLPVSVGSVLVDNTAPPAPSPAPTGLSPVASSPSITFNHALDPLSGGVHSGVDHYDVYRDGVLVHTVVDDGSTSFTWTDSALVVPPSSQSFAYTVKAIDKSGNTSGSSAALSILVDGSGTSAPTSVTALATPTNQAPQLSWVAPTGYPVDHYKLYRNGVFLINLPNSQTLFTDSGAAPGSYTYQVRAAQDPSPETMPLGVVSAAVSVVYDTAPPTAPAGTTATPAADGSISLAWGASSDAGSGVARYVARRALAAAAPATPSDGDAVCQGLVTSCTDSATLNGKAYSYAVFAVDGAGNVSAAGTALSVTASDQLAPAAPTGLAATPGDAKVDLRWTAAGADDDVAAYVLVAKAGAAAPTSDTDGTRVCSTLVATSTACSATGLTNGATYTFGLFALDEAFNRSPAAAVTAVPNGPVADATAPAAVKGLGAKVSGHTVTLTWKNPADKDFDHVEITSSERKPAARKAATRVYSGKGTKATTTLGAGVTRWFAVVAYDRVGNASAPATVSVTVKAVSPFGPAPSAKVHGAVQLRWPVVKGARYYNVQLYAGKKRILVSWPGTHGVTLPKAKLKRGVKYTWYVWPGLGAKSKAHYGKLIGKNVFTYAG